MRFKYHPVIPTSDASEGWRATRSGWSFLILHDKGLAGGFYASYRRLNVPVELNPSRATATGFHGDREHIGGDYPLDFAHATVEEAQRACEVKHDQLRRAGHG